MSSLLRVSTLLLCLVPYTACSSSESRPRILSASADLPPRGYDVVSVHLEGRPSFATRTMASTVTLDLVIEQAGLAAVELDAAVTVRGARGRGQDVPFIVDPAAARITLDVAKFGLAVGEHFILDIDYEAAASRGLVFYDPAANSDPVSTHVVYTTAEPREGRLWLPGNHRPQDRALFSASLTVDAEDEVVANGQRLDDTISGPLRRISYALPVPIPTYLMAFAAGGLVQDVDATPGDVPLSVWHRRGVPYATARQFQVMRDGIRLFADKLGPYPFGAYAVALLPGYPGGMENATITFNSEVSGQGAVDIGLNAHELGHQWFGDYVTIRNFRDLWIKEGMATLLGSIQYTVDRQLRPELRLDGEYLAGRLGAAIVPSNVDEWDPEATLYTGGQYGRAGSLFTQIRDAVGEETFWRTLRRVLEQNAFGTLDTEGIIAAFAPALGPDGEERMRRALVATGAPALRVEERVVQDASSLVFTMDDTAAPLLTELLVTTIAADGATTQHPLTRRGETKIARPIGGYVAVDEKDVFPRIDGPSAELLASYAVPTTAPAMQAFRARATSHQEAAIPWSACPNSANMAAEFAGLGSHVAQDRYVELSCACRTNMGPADRAPFDDALLPLLVARREFQSAVAYGGTCGVDLARRAFADEFPRAMADASGASSARVLYIANFDLGADSTLAQYRDLALSSPELKLRGSAVARIVRQVTDRTFERPTARLAEAYTTAFFELLPRADEQGLEALSRGFLGLDVTRALGPLAEAFVRLAPAARRQRPLVCNAYRLAGSDAAAFAAYAESVRSVPTLTAEVRALLDTPSSCPPAP